jgi:hypothetical protein
VILKELERDKKFMEFYIKVCDELGFAMEANAYRAMLAGEYTIE